MKGICQSVGRPALVLALVLLLGASMTSAAPAPAAAPASPVAAPERPRAIPLVTHDPYLSCWSFGENLYDDWTKHWTGKNHGMCGLIRVDGKVYRWMGGRSAAVGSSRVDLQACKLEYSIVSPK